MHHSHKNFLQELNLLSTPKFELDEVSTPFKIEWKNDCTLESISYGHGIMTTPLQVATAYSTISNGGYIVKPTLRKTKVNLNNRKQVIKETTSAKMNEIL